MKTYYFKRLLLVFTLVFFMACDSDDDGDSLIFDMVIGDRSTGDFFTINTSDGSLTSLGNFTFEGSPLLSIRDLAYNSTDNMIYASENQNAGGKIYRIDPTTLEATVINDNASNNWYAVAGIEISNGKLLCTVYFDGFSSGDSELMVLNTDGSIDTHTTYTFNNSQFIPCCGMGLAFGNTSNEVYIGNENELFVSDLQGNVSQEYDNFDYIGFPTNGLDPQDGNLKSLEKDSNGNLYAVNSDGYFFRIDLANNTATYIATLASPTNNWQGLEVIPTSIFN